MDGLGIRPQTAASGVFEEFAGLRVHAATLAASRNGKDKSSKPRKCEFAFSCKILLGYFEGMIDLLGDNIEKSLKTISNLA